ncbi:MAG: DUF2911 domain-containing protein [Acidobacteria bacterium]|nr:MAG: DUF2911 domain-containing protein [Acidobacteriota bacterium]REJ98003.1 MAG: DUF2911 domain-containing protein [Acidobacteriota bacterium]REK16746.1 MAG: DUF2911 domain-containing protein [Acidobacteriota bacterium]REK42657.1 MAG: DUF2911 domain-containing protein [Acidobacteriota bacterium]
MRFFAVAAILTFLSGIGLAQDRPERLNVPTLSPFTEITQEVALTDVKLTYARPSAKGRTIFGGLVPFNEIWRTGANASTKLTFKEDVTVGGNQLKAGTYALYTIPGNNEWTMIIHSNLGLRSLAGDVYKEADDVFRFRATPKRTAGFVETFTIEFANITTDSVDVVLSWENTMVPFTVKFDVNAQVDAQIAKLLADEATANEFNYFLAAEFYFHNDRDLDKAVEWITTGLEKSPKNPRFGLLYAKILDKQGKRTDALRVIAEANAWARESNNSNYTEQTQIFWESIK